MIAKTIKNKAFTLIELLVVIAIIALLMSILVPALSRIKRQAQAAVCLSNLKQWSLIYSMYLEDHDGFFSQGYILDSGSPGGVRYTIWMRTLRKYYVNNPKIRCCPTSIKPRSDDGVQPFTAWGVFGANGTTVLAWQDTGDYGSYGENGYNHNVSSYGGWGRPERKFWKHISVKNTSQIPLLFDAAWVDAWPDVFDDPPAYDGEVFTSPYNPQDIKVFCMNRHNQFLNGLFFDLSARKIGLKELWKLYWHRDWKDDLKQYGMPIWPYWMEKFKDF